MVVTQKVVNPAVRVAVHVAMVSTVLATFAAVAVDTRRCPVAVATFPFIWAAAGFDDERRLGS